MASAATYVSRLQARSSAGLLKTVPHSSCAASPKLRQPQCRSSDTEFYTAGWGGDSQQQHSYEGVVPDKYERVLRFVEENSSCQILLPSAAASDFCTSTIEEIEPDVHQWHYSYDEEVEEAEDDGNAVAVAGVLSSGTHSMPFSDGSCCATEVSMQPIHVDSRVPEASSSGMLSFPSFQPMAPLTELQHPVLTGASRARVQHVRIPRAMRRRMPQPQPCYGDLEHMQPWVDPTASTAAARATKRAGAPIKFAQFMERNAVLPLSAKVDGLMRLCDLENMHEFRVPHSWHLTFDEDAHGSFDEGVMGTA